MMRLWRLKRKALGHAKNGKETPVSAVTAAAGIFGTRTFQAQKQQARTFAAQLAWRRRRRSSKPTKAGWLISDRIFILPRRYWQKQTCHKPSWGSCNSMAMIAQAQQATIYISQRSTPTLGPWQAKYQFQHLASRANHDKNRLAN
jgi:hypothetical protein